MCDDQRGVRAATRPLMLRLREAAAGAPVTVIQESLASPAGTEVGDTVILQAVAGPASLMRIPLRRAVRLRPGDVIRYA